MVFRWLQWHKAKSLKEIWLMYCGKCKTEYFDIESPMAGLGKSGQYTICPKCGNCGGVAMTIKRAIITQHPASQTYVTEKKEKLKNKKKNASYEM